MFNFCWPSDIPGIVSIFPLSFFLFGTRFATEVPLIPLIADSISLPSVRLHPNLTYLFIACATYKKTNEYIYILYFVIKFDSLNNKITILKIQ